MISKETFLDKLCDNMGCATVVVLDRSYARYSSVSTEFAAILEGYEEGEYDSYDVRPVADCPDAALCAAQEIFSVLIRDDEEEEADEDNYLDLLYKHFGKGVSFLIAHKEVEFTYDTDYILVW